MSEVGVVEQSNPATGEIFAEVHETPPKSIRKIFKRSRAAQKKWSKKSFKDRSIHLYKMRDYIHENIRKITKSIVDCTGKTYQIALNAEVIPCIMSIDWNCKNAPKVLKEKKVNTDNVLFKTKTSIKTYVPVGVVGIITPWNYPLSIPFVDAIMSLICGNSVVLKVATQTIYMGKIIEDIIKAGELPKGLFHHIVCPGSHIGKIFLENGVNKLVFTGSVRVGKILSKMAADFLIPCVLELGGNDPAVVLEDANLELTSNGIIFGAFQNTGQACASIERCFVHEKIYYSFCEIVKKKVCGMRHGIPSEECDVHIGSMTKKSQLDVVVGQFKDAIQKGAKILARSKPAKDHDLSNGFFFPATVLVKVTNEMDLMKLETFGPILAITSFSKLEDVINECNDDDLALTASVWTSSTKNGKIVANQLDGGVVCINSHGYTHAARPGLEWGGWKNSGIGRTHGTEGLLELVNHKIIDYESIVPSMMNKRDLWHYDGTPKEAKKNYESCFLMEKFVYSGSVPSLLNFAPSALKKMSSSWIPLEEEDSEEEEESEESSSNEESESEEEEEEKQRKKKKKEEDDSEESEESEEEESEEGDSDSDDDDSSD